MNRRELSDLMRGHGGEVRRLSDDQKAAMNALDAARYRFLRDSNDAKWRPFALRAGGSAGDMDALVDEAMEASKR